MLPGALNTNALVALDHIKIPTKPTGVTSGMLGPDLYFIETRDGKVDPTFNLENIYAMHRQVVLHFILGALSQDKDMLDHLVTDASKVKIEGPKDAPPGGDMDVYISVLEQLPVVRSSKPADDEKRRRVTYRVPIGDEALALTLVKADGIWKIDTAQPVHVSLKFFYK